MGPWSDSACCLLPSQTCAVQVRRPSWWEEESGTAGPGQAPKTRLSTQFKLATSGRKGTAKCQVTEVREERPARGRGLALHAGSPRFNPASRIFLNRGKFLPESLESCYVYTGLDTDQGPEILLGSSGSPARKECRSEGREQGRVP